MMKRKVFILLTQSLKIAPKRLMAFCLLAGFVLVWGLNANAQTPTTYTIQYNSAGDRVFPKVISPQASIAATSPGVYLVGAGGAGAAGLGTIPRGGGGGGGGASVKVTGYEIASYAIPFRVGAGGSGNGQSSTFGNGEVVANGGSQSASGSSGAGGAARSLLPVSSSYGSSVNVTASYKGGNGGTDFNNGLDGVGGGGGSGAGKAAAGNTGQNGRNILIGTSFVASGGDAVDGFSGSGGNGGNMVVWIPQSGKAGSNGGGGGGGGASTLVDYFAQPGGNGGHGRVEVEVAYTYTGLLPAPVLDKTDFCYEQAALNEQVTITNPESDLIYTWYRATDAAGTIGRTQLQQGTGSGYYSYTVTTPGFYFVEACRLDTTLILSYFPGAAGISPHPFRSDQIRSEVVKFGLTPVISDISTTYNCQTGAITSSSFTGVIPEGTTYTWGTPTNPNAVTGTTTGSNLTAFTSGNLLNLGSSNAVVTYTVTPKCNVNGVNCEGEAVTIKLTVPPSGLSLTTTGGTIPLCPSVLNKDSVTINLFDYVEYTGDTVLFYTNLAGTTLISQNPAAYKLPSNTYATTIYASASNATCKLTPQAIVFQPKYGIFVDFAWSEDKIVTELCATNINLTKLVPITKTDYYHDVSVNFYDKDGLLIPDPADLDLSVLSPEERVFTVKLINNSYYSGCVFEETFTIDVKSNPLEYGIPVSDQTVCPLPSSDIVYNLMDVLSSVADGVYFFYSDAAGEDLIASYDTQDAGALPTVVLSTGSVTDFWVAMGCVGAMAPITPLAKFTVTITPMPTLDITRLWVCNGGGSYVNLTSNVSEIVGSNEIATGYKYTDNWNYSYVISNPSNVYIYPPSTGYNYKYYVSVENTVTGCTSDILLPIDVLPAAITKTITVVPEATEVDLTKGIIETAIPTEWLSYYTYEEDEYIPVIDPEQVAWPTTLDFYVKVENIPCFPNYLPLNFRVANPSVAVRDSSFCVVSATAQSISIQNRIIIPANAQDAVSVGTANADSLIVYSDAAGTIVIGKAYLNSKIAASPWVFTSGSANVVSFAANEFGIKEVYVCMVQDGVSTELSKLIFARWPSSGIIRTIGVRPEATEVDLTKGIAVATIPTEWVSYYTYEEEEYIPAAVNPEQVAWPTTLDFYVKVENIPCFPDYLPLNFRVVDPNVAVRDSSFCTSDSYLTIDIQNRIILPANAQDVVGFGEANADSLIIYSDAAGTIEIGRAVLYNKTSTSPWTFRLGYSTNYFSFNYGEFGAKTVYVRLIQGGEQTDLSSITVARWNLDSPSSSITQAIAVRTDATEVDLTKGTRGIPADWVSYYKYEEDEYILIDDPEHVALPLTAGLFAKVENVPCFSGYTPFDFREINLNIAARDTVFCTTGTYSRSIDVRNLISLPHDIQAYYVYDNSTGTSTYNYAVLDSLIIYSDAAGTLEIGRGYVSYLYYYDTYNSVYWDFSGNYNVEFDVNEFGTKEIYVRWVLSGEQTDVGTITVTHNKLPELVFPGNLTITAPKYTLTNVMDYVESIEGGYGKEEVQLMLAVFPEGIGEEAMLEHLYMFDATQFDPANVYKMEIAGENPIFIPATMPEGRYSVYVAFVGTGGVFNLSTFTFNGGCNNMQFLNNAIIKVTVNCSVFEIGVPETQPVEVCGNMLASRFVSNFNPSVGFLSFALWNGETYEPVESDKIPNELGTYKYEVTFTGFECPTVVKEIEFEVTKSGVEIQTTNLIYCDLSEVPVGEGIDLDLKTAVLSPALNPEDENTVWRLYYMEENAEVNIPEGLVHISDVALPDNFRISKTVYLEYASGSGCVYVVPISVNIGAPDAPVPVSMYMDAATQEDASMIFTIMVPEPGMSLLIGEVKSGSVLDFSLLVSNLLPQASLIVNPVGNMSELIANESVLMNVMAGDLSEIQELPAIADPLAYTIPPVPMQGYLIRTQNEGGCASNPMIVIVGSVGGLFIWEPNPYDSQWNYKTDEEMREWNDATNWNASSLFGLLSTDDLQPNANTDVYIGGQYNTYYPDLTNTDDAVCKNIYFGQGAEVIRPDKLTYERAYVTLNFGLEDPAHPQVTEIDEMEMMTGDFEDAALKLQALAALSATNQLSRNQWHQLSAPLGDMVTGDYSFGGFPATYLRKFSASATTTGTALVGNWSNYFTSTTAPLAPAEGFVLSVNDYRDRPLYREFGSGVDSPFGAETREYGLAKSNGLMVFPYHDIQEWSDARHIHLFDAITNTSRFYGVEDREANLPLLNTYGEKVRTAAAGRFIFEQAAGTPNVTYPVTAGDVVWADDTHRFAMVGNPYMSSIDFDRFYADNSASIKNGYYLFTGEEYQTYSPFGSDLNRYIAPMQSFMVEMQTGVQAADLNFVVENISLPREDVSYLRSSQQPIDQLKITLRNESGSSNAYLASCSYGSETVNHCDLAKLITGVKASPQVYTLKDTSDGMKKSALANHFIPAVGDFVIPLGIVSSSHGFMQFTLTGMDGCRSRISFIDVLSGEEKDISREYEFNYSFSYSPFTDGKGQVLASENRFFLHISDVTTGIDDHTFGRIKIYDSNSDICVVSSSANLLKQVLITDVQGRVLYRNDSVGAASVSVHKPSNLPAVYIVKVVAEHSTQTQKLITK